MAGLLLQSIARTLVSSLWLGWVLRSNTRWMQDIVGWACTSCTMVWKSRWVWARSKQMLPTLYDQQTESISEPLTCYCITLFCLNYHLQYFELCVWVDNVLASSQSYKLLCVPAVVACAMFACIRIGCTCFVRVLLLHAQIIYGLVSVWRECNFSYTARYFMPKIYSYVTDRHCSTTNWVGLAHAHPISGWPRGSQRVEHGDCQKPSWSSITLIVKSTYWPCFLLNA